MDDTINDTSLNDVAERNEATDAPLCAAIRSEGVQAPALRPHTPD